MTITELAIASLSRPVPVEQLQRNPDLEATIEWTAKAEGMEVCRWGVSLEEPSKLVFLVGTNAQLVSTDASTG